MLNIDLAKSRFRARKGTRVWFTLSRAAAVEVAVTRGGRTVAKLSLPGAAGGNDLKLRFKPAKSFKRGPHRIAFTPVAADGTRGASRTLKATLR